MAGLSPVRHQAITWTNAGLLFTGRSGAGRLQTIGANFHVSSSDLAKQATGLNAWTSRVTCPAPFVPHWHNILTNLLCFTLGMWNRLDTLGRLPCGVSLKFRLLHRMQRNRHGIGRHRIGTLFQWKFKSEEFNSLCNCKHDLSWKVWHPSSDPRHYLMLL